MSNIIEVTENDLIIQVGGSASVVAGVTTLNSLAGALTLAAGSGIAINSDGSSILTFHATGSAAGSDITFANLVATSGVLQTQIDNISVDGVVYTTGNQNISGDKTFFDTIVTDNITGRTSTVGIDLLEGIINIAGRTTIDFNSRSLKNTAGSNTLNWNNYTLNDPDTFASANWNLRTLSDNIGGTSLSWSGKILSGDWITNTAPTNSLHIVNYGTLNTISGVLQTNFNNDLNSTGQSLYILVTGLSGQTATDYATKIQLTQTGVDLLGIIQNTGQQSWTAANNNSINLSGNLYTTGTLLSAVQITGSSTINIANFTGSGGINIVYNGNQIIISGGEAGGTTNNYFVNSGSGAYFFRTLLQSGVTTQFINFPYALDEGAKVVNSIGSYDSSFYLNGQVTGLSTTGGYWLNLTDTTNGSGFYVDTIATFSNNTGFSTYTIVNTSYSDGINLSGNLYTTGSLLSAVKATGSSIINNVNLTGLGSVTVRYDGTYVSISGAAGGGGGSIEGGANLGNGTGVFEQVNGTNLEFNSIQTTGNLSLVKNNNTLYISGGLKYIDAGNSTTGKVIDWNSGNYQRVLMTNNCTFSFIEPTYYDVLRLKLVQNTTGNNSGIWPSSVKWVGGVSPNLTVATGATDIVTFLYDTNYYGTILLDLF